MRVLYISRSKLEHSVNAVYIKGLEKSGVQVIGFFVSQKGIRGYLEAIKFLKKRGKSGDVVIVGYDSPGFVILARIIGKKKVVYNALCSVYERLIVSRNLVPKFSLKSFYYWFLDFWATRCAELTMVETSQQADYFKKLFKVSGEKIFIAPIGVDEDVFSYDPSVPKFERFTILFRGALMPESGAEYVVKAAKILEKEDIKFVMIGGGILLENIRRLKDELNPANLELITDFLPNDKLVEFMNKSHLSLGQLSSHERLDRTIPHKCYESLAIGLPYLTASNKAVLELLKDGETCLACKPNDAGSLAEKIMWAKKNPEALNKIAKNGYRLFQNKLNSKILAAKLINKIFV